MKVLLEEDTGGVRCLVADRERLVKASAGSRVFADIAAPRTPMTTASGLARSC